MTDTTPLSTTSATTAAPATTTPATQQPAGEGKPWYASIQDEGTRTWAEAKGFKDPLAVVESAYNLEKLMGFDKAGRTIVVPDDKATPEQVSAFRAKLGVPEKADGYKLPIPEGGDDAFAKTASSWFHEAGIPAKSAETLAAKWNDYAAAVAQQQEDAFHADTENGLKELQAEYGEAFEQNVELGKRASKQFIPAKSDKERDAVLGKIQRAIGTKDFVRLFSSIGAGLAEHKNQNGEGSSMILTPAQAKQQLQELKSNKEWLASFQAGDPVKAAEKSALAKMANPSYPE